MTCTGTCKSGGCSNDKNIEDSAEGCSSTPTDLRPQVAPHVLIHGEATGPLLYTDTPLSFWGGLDAATGVIIDVHHPLQGQSLAGRVLALPGGRGSCSGSLGLLECIMAGNGPAGIVLAEPDYILALGALVGREIFNVPIPVVVAGRKFPHLARAKGGIAHIASVLNVRGKHSIAIPLAPAPDAPVSLSEEAESTLRGESGEALQLAMKLVIAMAKLYGADSLVDIKGAHIDACIYVGPATLSFAKHFASLGAQFAVPTTLNAISVDARRWRDLGVSALEAEPALELSSVYQAMGAMEDPTCAPYLLPSVPALGQHVGWGESNAVVFANSVLGARTIKYPDMLDVLVAITGWAPLAGCHTDAARHPTVKLCVPAIPRADSSYWPLLGYAVGGRVGAEVALVTGLESSHPSTAELKAFGAAFATTSASPMFHIAGVTPESPNESNIRRTIHITLDDLQQTWGELNTATDDSVGFVAFGNPHLAYEEIAYLAELTAGRKALAPVIITCGRYVERRADSAGYLTTLREFGAQVLTDTCWCMIREPVVPPSALNFITDSAKYAHYGPGGIGKGAHFASMEDCVEAACRGSHQGGVPVWLEVEVEAE